MTKISKELKAISLPKDLSETFYKEWLEFRQQMLMLQKPALENKPPHSYLFGLDTESMAEIDSFLEKHEDRPVLEINLDASLAAAEQAAALRFRKSMSGTDSIKQAPGTRGTQQPKPL